MQTSLGLASGFLIAAWLAVMPPAAAGGEVVVHLRSGRSFRGEVIEQTTDTIRFRTASGITTELRPDDIARIETGVFPDPRPGPATQPQRLPSPIGKGEHSPTCPRDCKLCERMFRHSLDSFCAEVLRRDDLSPIPVRLGAWPALQVPACSVLGLVLLGEGDALRPGLHQRTVLKLTRHVSDWSLRDHRSLTAHRSWSVAFATLFLAELHRLAPSDALHRRLELLVRVLESGRQGERGWCHGLKRSGYGPFVGVTIWCAAALGAARDQGVEVHSQGLAQTFAGLRRSIGPVGGASYWVAQGSSVSVGRTGGVAWVLQRYGGADGKEDRHVAAALNFLLRHVEDAKHGHASGLMNFTWGALGAESFGPNERRVFWHAHARTVLEARAGDGRFAVQPWKDRGHSFHDDTRPPSEADGTTWPDRMYGDGWATCWMLLAWQVGRGQCVLTRPPAAEGPQ